MAKTSRFETWRWGLAVVVCAAFAACAPSLNAVKSTAGLGTQLASFESTFDVAATYCRFADLGGTPDPQCQQLQADAANWHAVNRALVGYAAALSAMADDSKDQNQQTTIATALGASAQIGKAWSNVLNANVTSGISQGVATLISGITGVYRRERLAVVIKASADAVAAVARGIDDNIALLDRAAQNLTATLGDTLTSIQLGSAPAADRLGLAFALASVKIELASHRAALASYKAAVDAFAKAHATLRNGLNGLGERKADLELSQLIATDVVQIVQSTQTALTPVAVPPTAPVAPAH
ncbi:MAG TPA: hypothetical protein VFP84_07760 [Kofleriaceae bacterium]|nr:hypothetical protein [Kofleriaceae bacterium]